MDAWRTDTEAWQKGYKQALSVTDTWAVFRCVAFLLVALSQIHSITNVVTSLGSPATRLLIFKILFLDNLILWWFLRKFIFPFFSPSLLPPILISFHPSFVFSPVQLQPNPRLHEIFKVITTFWVYSHSYLIAIFWTHLPHRDKIFCRSKLSWKLNATGRRVIKFFSLNFRRK